MRILRIGQNIKTGEKGGGGAYHMHALSRDQAKQGHEVTVITIDKRKNQQSRRITNGDWSYNHIICPQTVDILGNKLSFAQIKKTTDLTDYDVIHLHSHFFFSTFVPTVLNIRSETPIAITNHSLYSQSIPLWLSKAQLRTMGRITYSLSDVIFCYTEFDKEKLRSLGVSTEIEVIPNGIDTSKFTPQGTCHPAMEQDNDGLNILFVGRLVDGKRPEMAAKGFAQIYDDHPNCDLYYCGDGPKRNELHQLINQLNIESRTHLLGETTYEKMPEVYRGADILVLPSKAEGFPRTILESLASGVPVIASSLPQTRSVVEQTGRVIKGDCENDIAKKLSWMITNDEERSKLGRTGQELITKKYSWNRLVEQTTEVLERISS